MTMQNARGKGSRIALVAPLLALMFVGAGCGDLWDKYVMGIDREQEERESNQRAEWYMQREQQRHAEEAAKEAAKLPPRPTPSQTYKDLAAKTPDEIRAAAPIAIKVLNLDGELFPFPDDQFRLSQPDDCKVPHYHASVGFSLSLQKVSQPSNPCGFGADVVEQEVETEAIIKWMQVGPKAAH